MAGADDAPLLSAGLDSLSAVELRNQLQQQLALQVVLASSCLSLKLAMLAALRLRLPKVLHCGCLANLPHQVS